MDTIWISDWRVLKANWPERAPTYHFFGNVGGFSGANFSSPIVQFSQASRWGQSESGMWYYLQGRAGDDKDADFLCKSWLAKFSMVVPEIFYEVPPGVIADANVPQDVLEDIPANYYHRKGA